MYFNERPTTLSIIKTYSFDRPIIKMFLLYSLQVHNIYLEATGSQHLSSSHPFHRHKVTHNPVKLIELLLPVANPGLFFSLSVPTFKKTLPTSKKENALPEAGNLLRISDTFLDCAIYSFDWWQKHRIYYISRDSLS